MIYLHHSSSPVYPSFVHIQPFKYVLGFLLSCLLLFRGCVDFNGICKFFLRISTDILYYVMTPLFDGSLYTVRLFLSSSLGSSGLVIFNKLMYHNTN